MMTGCLTACLLALASIGGLAWSAASADRVVAGEGTAVHESRSTNALLKVCKEYISKYNCRLNVSTKKQIRMAQILLCLEGAVNNDYAVGDECKAEMLEHRKSLMEHYQLTPDLVERCESDINHFCKDRIGSRTLHCLMEHIRPTSSARDSFGNVYRAVVSDKCRTELLILLKEINAGEDWRVDPLLQQSCLMTANAVCRDVTPGEGRMLRCLMSYLDSSYMSGDCRKSLLQLQYFISRDFELDIPLYKSCHNEAVKHCHAVKGWFKNREYMEPDRGPLIMSCLYRRAYHPDKNVALSPQCLYDVRRVMRQRARSIDLMPDFEEPCISDLALYCSHDSESLTKKGFEMECLQEKLDYLSRQCRDAVANFTEDEAEYVELNYPLYKYCSNVLKKVCNEEERETDQGELMQCLIDHKNTPSVEKYPKCRAAIEHFQLLSLKDYRFNYKFKEACEEEVLKHCSAVRTKFEVVACLSTLAFNDSISGTLKRRLKPECKNQLRVELLERSENILLDPKLHNACENDRRKFCSTVSYGAGQVLECLRGHMPKLSKPCHKLLFRRERIEMMDNSVDYALMTSCKQSIKKYCDPSKTKDVLFCLRDHRNDGGLEPYCRKLVLKRLADQNQDYRLNPRLKSYCKEDIRKFCVDVLVSAHPDEELDGKVITCLKKQYIKNRLSQTCEIEMVSLIRVISENLELDPHVMKACAEDLRAKCSEDSDLQECLKNKFRKGDLESVACRKEVALLIAEEKPDIKSDPVLYKACIHEIKIYCNHVPPGHGMQLACLLDELNAKSKMSDQCGLMLSQRVDMYRSAAQTYADNVADVVKIITDSPSRNYFVFVLMSVVGLLFMMGLVCGRVTKRGPIKNE